MRNLLHHFDRLPSTRTLRRAGRAGDIVGLSVFAKATVDMPATLMIALITVYQHTLSPDHGPLRHFHSYGYCRHSPTCSVYAKQAISQRGALIGGFLALKRVLSCNPFAKPSKERLLEVASRL